MNANPSDSHATPLKDPWPHLADAAKAVMPQGVPARLRFLKEDRWIGYPKAKEILEDLSDLVESDPVVRPPCRLIVGATNNGKTRLLHRLLFLHQPSYTLGEGHATIPVVYVQAPPLPNEARFYASILRAMKAPFRDNDTVRRLESQVLRTVPQVGLRVLLVDEVHHAIAGNRGQYHAFLQVLKAFTTNTGVSIVAAGIDKAHHAMQTDPQLSNRFDRKLLPTWAFDDNFRSLLASMEKVIPLEYPSNLQDPTLAERIHALTEGRIGEAGKLLRAAAKVAIANKRERIDLHAIEACGYQRPETFKSLGAGYD